MFRAQIVEGVLDIFHFPLQIHPSLCDSEALMDCIN